MSAPRRPVVAESVTTEGHIGAPEMLAHALLIICTCGLWYPVYRARKTRAERRSVTRHYGGPQ